MLRESNVRNFWEKLSRISTFRANEGQGKTPQRRLDGTVWILGLGHVMKDN